MYGGIEKRAWRDTALFSAAAFLLFQVSVLFFLFAVPLFLLGLRRGQRPLLYGAAVVAAAVLVQTALRSAHVSDGAVRGFFFVLEAGYPLALMIGVAAVCMERGRSLFGMLKGTAVVALASIPLMLVFSGNEELIAFLEEQIGLLIRALRESLTPEASTGSMLGGAGTQELVRFFGQVYVRTYLFGYFLLLSASWLLSRVVHSRSTGGGSSFTLDRFGVPERLLWPFLIAWAGVLLDALAGLAAVGFVFWNAALILLFLYGLQGVGVMKTLFRRYGVGQGLRIAVSIAAIIILLTPRLNLVLIIGVPLLGLSEYWVRYRER